jgi:hypothetical protein
MDDISGSTSHPTFGAGLRNTAPQLLPYVVTLLALLAVGVRKTRGRNRHDAWHFEL